VSTIREELQLQGFEVDVIYRLRRELEATKKLKSQVPPLIAKLAGDLGLQVHGSPFHAAEGVELWKQGEDPDTLICVGYILGPENTAIYRRIDSKKDVFCRNKLWFVYGWLIKPRPHNNQYRVLRKIPTFDFTDELFVAIARDELEKKNAVNRPRHR